jgi:hypothetical protein
MLRASGEEAMETPVDPSWFSRVVSPIVARRDRRERRRVVRGSCGN